MNEHGIIKSFVLHSYGNLISAEEPEFEEQTKTWLARIKSDYPIVLKDDRDPEHGFVQFMPIKDIGIVRFSEDLKPLKKESTPREECIRTLQNLLSVWKDRTEKIVVQASADYFVNIPEFSHFFVPIQEIVDYLLEHNEINDDVIMKYRPKDKKTKIKQYLKLLEGLDFIRRINEGYERGNIFLLLLKKCETESDFTEDNFRKAILSTVIRERYSALRDMFEISRLQRTIHVDSVVYRPALEAEKQIYLSTESIAKYYNEYGYGRINSMTLTHIVKRLQSVGAINREGNYWTGTEELLDDMLKIKNEMPALSPPITTY